ncbi:MAG TPA: type II secretion system minor pseudopilin GspI [Gammaproteobacteria bacterium]|nr:type II secretion system minor pseudopilin GspI [Gammaproteobacteria bacterium]
MRRDRRRSGGFTLIEVLIALAVLAIAMLAVIGTAGTSTHIAGQLRDETLAHWVAINELTALRVSPTWPSLGKQDGDANMGGRKWHWKVNITKTSDPDLLRADIDVSDAAQKDQVVSSLTGFLGRPMPNIPSQFGSGTGGTIGTGHDKKGGG